MRTWQWKIIQAMIRCILDPHNIKASDIVLLNEALKRDRMGF